MRKLGMWAAILMAAGMLLATPFAVAGSPKGVCQAGGYNKVVLADAMAKYWTWYYGGVGSQQMEICSWCRCRRTASRSAMIQQSTRAARRLPCAPARRWCCRCRFSRASRIRRHI